MKILFVLFVATLLAACATTPETPAQRLFSLQSKYNSALAIAVAYESQPRCQEPPVQPCSNKAVVDKLRASDDVAWALFKQARTVVATPGTPQSTVDTVLLSVGTAVDAFKAIADTVR